MTSRRAPWRVQSDELAQNAATGRWPAWWSVPPPPEKSSSEGVSDSEAHTLCPDYYPYFYRTLCCLSLSFGTDRHGADT
jgi:hypothetical protein